ncbi:MAG TPA: ATPase domain-containing protein [Verrucomicrobiae bacterium]|nr:ATPase domain-containing protein [Verrucomicrobiae bacterium]
MAKPRISTGVAGLDDVLCGGLSPDRLYLLEGMPGSGKTTLAFQFLKEGVKHGESVLYVSLSETRAEIEDVAESHGWSLDGIAFRELVPGAEKLEPGQQYTVFHPSEVELSETTEKIVKDVEKLRPTRIVIDSLSELRLLAGSALRYRRQILALKHYMAGRQCTVLLLDDLTATERDVQVQSIAHGAIMMEHTTPDFGISRRRLSVIKYRGSAFRGGFHDYLIQRGGLEVYPRLVAAEHRGETSRARLASGVTELDKLMGGGIERGTSTLIQGAAGTGKSTIATLFAVEAASRGEKSAIFMFDESVNTLQTRMAALGKDLRGLVDKGLIHLIPVDPAELSPGELVHSIRQQVEKRQVSIVVIDSLNGYLNSMPDERFLVVQLHELLTYLGQSGVATMLIAAHTGLISSQMSSPVDASYLADAVVLLRYFEVAGQVKQALSVVKMRGGDHERSLREFSTAGSKIRIGEPLRDYQGILTGVPHLRGGT